MRGMIERRWHAPVVVQAGSVMVSLQGPTLWSDVPPLEPAERVEVRILEADGVSMFPDAGDARLSIVRHSAGRTFEVLDGGLPTRTSITALLEVRSWVPT